MKDKITIYTDGSCLGNPGAGGYGAVIILSPTHRIAFHGGEKLSTNNKMELMAVIEALKYVLEHREDNNYEIDLYTDSNYVKLGIEVWIHSWKKNNWRTASKKAVKNQDLWKKLLFLTEQFQHIAWHWVKAHNNHYYNELCDQLANKAAQEQVVDFTFVDVLE